MNMQDLEIERLRNEIVVLQRNEFYMEELLTRAADALEDSLPMKQYASQFKLPYFDLIAELRKAAAE